MSFNFIVAGGSIKTSELCLHDSNIGYETDFSVDGNVGGWNSYIGIHTYGCWNNFLFGTLYGDTSAISRQYTFREVAAEDFYTIKVVMKLNLVERRGTQSIPTHGRITWTTISAPTWDATRFVDFDLVTTGEWYSYYINVGEVQEWQGDVNNLKVSPILQDGRDGDEFFIRTIQILSVDTYKCTNWACDYYANYEHPCAGSGKRGTCSSKHLNYLVQEGSTFESAVGRKYTIEENVNDIFIVNINGYGDETIKLPVTTNATGNQMAYILTKEISKINVGGYSEVEVEYNSIGQFVVHSGTYVDDSVVTVVNSPAAITLNFYDEDGNYQSDEVTGSCPVSGYRPLSSFRLSTNRMLRLFDSDDNSDFLFSPFIYNIEGGRRDWLGSGLGSPTVDVRGQEDDATGIMNRYYDHINNAGKTIIDFNHPFNASGRINKIYAAVTLDNYPDSYDSRGNNDAGRISTQLNEAVIMFFRPLRDGTIKVLSTTVPIKNRDHAAGNLYSATQEYVEIDCDIFVNKGDLMGVYNANIYIGQSISGDEVDALFYQVTGQASGILNVLIPDGEGSAGLLLYARSDQLQSRLLIDIDLSKRINIEGVDIVGTTINEKLEYNICRCLDVNWNIDLFDEDHTTGWVIKKKPYVDGRYNHPNIYYGKECLTDGIKTVSDGIAGTSFTVNLGTHYRSDEEPWGPPPHIQDGGNGIVVADASYFHVNGDSEWLSQYLLAGRDSPFAVDDFKRDPIAFTLICPVGKKKKFNKLKMYFKERFNFRSFALSFFKGDFNPNGTADLPTFDLIPNRSDGFDTPWTKIVLDGLECVPENEALWDSLALYLGTNPIVGHETIKITSMTFVENDPYTSYVSPHGGAVFDTFGTVTNNDQQNQALTIDWTTITIEWPPSDELGFRLYCDYHESTKICEMELFCNVENTGSLLIGSVSVNYSEYGDSVWPSEITQTADDHAYAFIGDTPRYITVEVAPITDVTLKEIGVSIGSGDVFLGEKGCEQQVFPIEAKTNADVNSFPVLFKNTYGDAYDLYVNIEAPISVDVGLLYYSKMNDEDSILNPEIGVDSYYRKGMPYPIRNRNYNVAINCPVYGMKNLVDGATAWYSHNYGDTWTEWGTLSSTTSIDFSNLLVGSRTILNIPVLVRSKWWKVGFLDSGASMNVRELRLYYQDEEIQGAKFYHEKGQGYIYGANTDTAPHLSNEMVGGSYYVLTGNQYIGIELPGVQKIDKMVFYHDYLEDYDNTIDVAGIDNATAFCLKGQGQLYQTDSIHDYSYYEHGLEVVGSGIYCDNIQNQFVNYNFTEDFSDCTALIDWATNTDYSSTFTCSSGIVGEDWVYEFDMAVSSWCNAAGYKIPYIYEKQYYPMDQHWAFDFNFKFNLEAIQHNGVSAGRAGVSVGVLRAHYYWRPNGYQADDYEDYFEGAQMIFAENLFGIAIQGRWCEGTQQGDGDVTTAGLVYGTTYYCTFSSDGNGVYTAKAWTDNWGGSNQVCNLTKTSSIRWLADKIGVGSGWSDYTYTIPRAQGWVADFNFIGHLSHDNNVFENNSIHFSGNVDEYLKVDYDNNVNCNSDLEMFDFNNKLFTIDTFIKFKSLPDEGEQVVLASCWEPGDIISTGTHVNSSWALTVENVSGTLKLRLYLVENDISGRIIDYAWNPDQNRWYNLVVCRTANQVNPLSGGGIRVKFDGHVLACNDYISFPVNINSNDVIVGENFNGWLQDFRISSSVDSLGGGRLPMYPSFCHYLYNANCYDQGTQTKPFERYYTFSLYISDDNLHYGVYADVDCFFNNSFSYYYSTSRWSYAYSSYFAIDLGHRYALDIIRSFPVDEAYQVTLHNNVMYSNINTSDPSLAFKPWDLDDINTGFSGGNKSIPDNWYTSGGPENYILYDKLHQAATADTVTLTTEFYLVKDFDFEIEYDLIGTVNIADWFCGLQIQDIQNTNNLVKMDRAFYSSHNRYRFNIRDNSSSWVTVTSSMTTHRIAAIRIVRDHQLFSVYIKDLAVGVPEEYILFGHYGMTGGFGDTVTLSITTQSTTPDNPPITVEWDNLLFTIASPIYSSYNDARWVQVHLPNGDGVTRTLKRLGIYPNISVQLTKDGTYNTNWVSLGESITSYVGEENLALGADVAAFSYAGVMRPENAVDGLLTSNLNQAWASSGAPTQWITVTLPSEVQIYRVVVHLSYDGETQDHLIQDYKVQISTDNITFTTIFDISDNTSHSRTHDLAEAVTAKYVKIDITRYKSKTMHVIYTGGEEYWSGATMRQIEVYEHYGFSIIDSETYPIIALDLNQNYFITGHSMVGIDSETTYTDWDNSNSNYTYSNSDLSDPKKVSFGYWGDAPDYEKWVVVKRNTATHYPTVPGSAPPPEAPYTDTKDFLKHLIINGSANAYGTEPNPINHHWMWNSNVSLLSYSHAYVRTTYTQRSLKIEYPASSQSDHVYFREGDNFGTDDAFSWRDGLSFSLYIDDIDNLDLSYGYIYFGGYDPTDAHSSVKYKWSFPTLSGVLHSGWNDLSLAMKAADDIEWTEPTDYHDPDPRILYLLTLQKLGLVFKGKGNSLTMYMDGFVIERNHFNDMSYFDRGLYMHGDDIFKVNAGELDFACGTLEFFLRPDWKLTGGDIYNDFKFRSLFHFGNVANDVFGAALSVKGLEIYHGNIIKDFTLFIIPELPFDILDKSTHMAFVFSNDGTGISNDGSTIRVYFDNQLIAKSLTMWSVSDRKHFNFMLGGQNLLLQKIQGVAPRSSSIDGVISNLKMYNYCKTDFSSSMKTPEIIGRTVLTKPSELIEISKDNLTFYNIDANELPFYYYKVPAGDTVTIHVKTTIPNGLTGKEIRTANLLAQWDIGV